MKLVGIVAVLVLVLALVPALVQAVKVRKDFVWQALQRDLLVVF